MVAASQGRLPLDARLLNDGLPTLVAVSDRAPGEAVEALAAKPGVEVARCGQDRVDLTALADLLQARGVRSLMAEGGSRLLHGLFEAGLVSKIVIKHIPVISGAPGAPTFLSSDAATSLPLSRWRLDDWFVKSGVGVSVYRPWGEAGA